jgi:hypothetical protein
MDKLEDKGFVINRVYVAVSNHLFLFQIALSFIFGSEL